MSIITDSNCPVFQKVQIDAINSGILDLNISLNLCLMQPELTARTSRLKCDGIKQCEKKVIFFLLWSHLRRKCPVQVVNVRCKCITANIPAGDLLDLPDRPWWKDAEVCEDIKFAIHVLHDNKAQYDRGNSPETADRSQTEFIVWKLAAIVSRGNIQWDE